MSSRLSPFALCRASLERDVQVYVAPPVSYGGLSILKGCTRLNVVRLKRGNDLT